MRQHVEPSENPATVVPSSGPGEARSPFDQVAVIFNPNSTGDAPRLAQELRDELVDRMPGTPIRLIPTAHAGHARELAYETAGSGAPLIVSVSGDGGYNEVVDGVMKANNPDVTCAVMAAGNANDHRRTIAEQPLATAIALGHVRRIDLLRLTLSRPDASQTRYAHSYIGIGLTPVVALDLEKGSKGSLKEMVTVVRTFARFRPFTIVLEDGTHKSIDSLLLANISQMAKHATLSADGRPDDGRFEIITMTHTAKWRVLGVAVKAATRGLGDQPTAHHYGFTVLKPTPLQLDGELIHLGANTRVEVDIAPRALATLS